MHPEYRDGVLAEIDLGDGGEIGEDEFGELVNAGVLEADLLEVLQLPE